MRKVVISAFTRSRCIGITQVMVDDKRTKNSK